jgi:hypothetical protein
LTLTELQFLLKLVRSGAFRMIEAAGDPLGAHK